ncbi:epsin-1 isoform X1 [Caretta caretta]|uniref:epsin-1 isoform X1 n=1 Tax=Caretta caretta TaxID=8467 RepID=UPI002094BC0B|nr:epsin-1 isoform X1 [Caretta caretta]
MSTSSLRRQMKNIVHNYSEAEIKVREATSNDPWGPSSSLMSEIADLTYNVVAFSEIMSMIWKRLNDHGKNWRHVYKAMTLMEYLIKTGSERVAQQCKENIYAIQTLKDFQYVDRDGKDQGVNVREKAKQLVALLRDDERLKEERAHALKTKEKLAQTSTASSASAASAPAEAEQAWPQSSGEEELQLQLALAMSKEEAEQVRSKPPVAVAEEDLQLQLALSLSKEEHDKEERIRRGDDLRLQMAIEESKKEAVPAKGEESSLMDLADVFTAPAPPVAGDPWGPPAPTDPWGASVPAPTGPPAPDPWGGTPGGVASTGDPWGASASVTAPGDPWGGPPAVASSDPWNPEGTGPSPLPAGGVAVSGAPPASDPWSSGPAAAPQGKPAADPWAPAQTFPDRWGGSPSKGSINGTAAGGAFEPDEFSDFDSLRPALPKSGSSTGELDLLAGEVPVSRSAGARSPSTFDMAAVGGSLAEASKPTRKTPESFLGPNAALVDLDSLLSKPHAPPSTKTSNPFLATGTAPVPLVSAPGAATGASATNPFQPAQPASLPLNQLRVSPVMGLGPPAAPFAPPMVSVTPLGPVVPLASVSPMVGVQPPGLSPMAMPPMMPPQPIVPTSASAQSMGNTNPFLL